MERPDPLLVSPIVPGAGCPERTRRAALTIAAVALACHAAAQTPVRPRILVMPFENIRRDAAIVWLGEASSVLLADDLNALGAAAITREERRQAFERLQVPPSAMLTDATVIRIGELVRASDVVTGTLQIEDGALVVHARAITLDTGRVSHDIVERGPVAELFAIVDRVARRLVPSGGARSDARADPPIATFENYIKGLLADAPARAIAYLNAALAATPAFDRARLALWDVYAEQGDHASALAAVTPVAAGSPWSRRATFLAGLSYLQLNRYDEAFATFKALADAQPTATALNNLGVVQIRRTPTPQTGLPAY